MNVTHVGQLLLLLQGEGSTKGNKSFKLRVLHTNNILQWGSKVNPMQVSTHWSGFFLALVGGGDDRQVLDHLLCVLRLSRPGLTSRGQSRAEQTMKNEKLLLFLP